ncbi:MAG: SUMF1/EgtB/PvdO family nonheme iron enzyme [Chloroflexi bacterium]|nr:SUMF1/EgtB/PvdO family nonheme iron enzyme [Chloroflexota bacterium]
MKRLFYLLLLVLVLAACGGDDDEKKPTVTPTLTLTVTASATPSDTPTITPSPTATITPSPTATFTPSTTPSQTPLPPGRQTAQALMIAQTQTAEVKFPAQTQDAEATSAAATVTQDALVQSRRETAVARFDAATQTAVASMTLPAGRQTAQALILAQTQTAAAPTAQPPTATLPPTSPAGPVTQEINGLALVQVPAGCWTMGLDDAGLAAALELCKAERGGCDPITFKKEMPGHEVCVSDYWIGQTEITNAQYAECVAAEFCDAPAESANSPTYYGDPGYENYPVVGITWFQAQKFAAWKDCSLPTEAQWEYAARGPENRMYPWGDVYDEAGSNSCLPGDWTCGGMDADLFPVGSFPAGASWVGALDLSGNAAEWVSDMYGDYPAEAQNDPTGPTSGDGSITRGGSYMSDPVAVMSVNRVPVALDGVFNTIGFRVVCPVP